MHNFLLLFSAKFSLRYPLIKRKKFFRNFVQKQNLFFRCKVVVFCRQKTLRQCYVSQRNLVKREFRKICKIWSSKQISLTVVDSRLIEQTKSVGTVLMFGNTQALHNRRVCEWKQHNENQTWIFRRNVILNFVCEFRNFTCFSEFTFHKVFLVVT